jgi:type II restriction enzyme
MDLRLNKGLAKGYSSKAQIARILTEDWVGSHVFCPNCGNASLRKFGNCKPVADFYCGHCGEEYELKSKRDKLSDMIPDGAYATMIARIQSVNNPHFFFLSYTPDHMVSNLLLIPKHFFSPSMIIMRPPLASSARRAGWVGCNIAIGQVAAHGRIFLVKDSKVEDPAKVRETFQKTLFLKDAPLEKRQWLLEILKCLDALPKERFSIRDVYRFEDYLQSRFPNNRHVQAKIRQQLQLLRNSGLVAFLGNGHYQKIR